MSHLAAVVPVIVLLAICCSLLGKDVAGNRGNGVGKVGLKEVLGEAT